MPTASQIAQLGAIPFLEDIYDGVITDTPLIRALPGRSFTGTRFKTLGRYSIPEGRFLDRNEGYVSGEVTWAVQESEAKRIGSMAKALKSSTLEWNQANQFGLDFMSESIRAQLEGDFLHLEKQCIYGTENDPKGFLGLKQLTPATLDSTLPDGKYAADFQYKKTTLNAGGSTSSTATSVYLLRTGPQGVELLFGGPQGMEGFLNYSDITEYAADEVDPVDGVKKHLEYFKSTGEGYVGLGVSGMNTSGERVIPQHAVRRIYNITNDTGKGLTAALLRRAISMFPTGRRPNLIVMNTRAQDMLTNSVSYQLMAQLGQSPSSSFNPSLQPLTSFDGIPIVVTDHIRNDEAIEVPA